MSGEGETRKYSRIAELETTKQRNKHERVATSSVDGQTHRTKDRNRKSLAKLAPTSTSQEAQSLIELCKRFSRDPKTLLQLQHNLYQDHRRHVQRRGGKVGNSCTYKRTKQRKPRVYCGSSSNLLSDEGSRGINSGSQCHGADQAFIPPRDSNKPSEFIVSELIDVPNTLVSSGDWSHGGYRNSLNNNVKNVGPVPLKVAARKLSKGNDFVPPQSPLPAADAYPLQTPSSYVSRASSFENWQGRSLADKGKNVIMNSSSTSDGIIQPADRQFLQEFKNEERLMEYENQYTAAPGIPSGSHFHNQVPNPPTHTTVHPSTYLRPKVSRTSSSLHGLGSSSALSSQSWLYACSGSSTQLNPSSDVEPSRPTLSNLDNSIVPQGQPGYFLKLLTAEKDMSYEEDEFAAHDVQPMMEWDQNSKALNESIAMGLGPARNPYPRRFGLPQLGMEQQSPAAGVSEVYRQWTSPVQMDAQELQRQLMQPPGEGSTSS